MTHTYVYDQILHGQGASQLGNLVAKLVYVLKHKTKVQGVSAGVPTCDRFSIHTLVSPLKLLQFLLKYMKSREENVHIFAVNPPSITSWSS